MIITIPFVSLCLPGMFHIQNAARECELNIISGAAARLVIAG
jgi:hypothetical protein